MKTTYGLPKKREQVINLLQQAYSEQNLDDTDFESRLQQAMDASSIEELKLCIHDFPNANLVFSEQSIANTFSSKEILDATLALEQKNTKQIGAFLGNVKNFIKGEVVNPLRLSTFMGEQNLSLKEATLPTNVLLIVVDNYVGTTNIDLRAPQFHGKQIKISLNNILGEIKILLPKGAQVHNDVFVILGEVGHNSQKLKNWFKNFIGIETKKETAPIQLTVFLEGKCILGEVSLVYY